jgi:signal transduction histidine kinase
MNESPESKPPRRSRLNLYMALLVVLLLLVAWIDLLGNACKYTPAGGKVRFDVQLRGQGIDFMVTDTDTGIGIANEEQARVFEKFFRSGDARVREVDGNGLGLTFTQEVVQSHGGRLTLESELNQGSTFTISLPIPEREAR